MTAPAVDRTGRVARLSDARKARTAKALMGERTADETRETLRLALDARLNLGGNGYVWIRDFTSSWLVYEVSGDAASPGLFAAPYAVDPFNDTVAFGTPVPVEVRTDYEPTDSAPDAQGEPLPFMAKSRYVAKAGARNNKADLTDIQTVHDKAVALGATCGVVKATAKPTHVHKAVAGPVVKSDEAKRYTFAPMYPASPESPTQADVDAHGDVATADDLQGAVWDYVRKGDRALRLQHLDDVVVGEVVEIVSWPFEQTVDLTLPTGETVTKTYAPGTVFMGTVWTTRGWEMVQKGLLRGFSLGGSAHRVDVAVNA